MRSRSSRIHFDFDQKKVLKKTVLLGDTCSCQSLVSLDDTGGRELKHQYLQ